MKILIDQNISHRIIPLLVSNFPEIEHVKSFGLQRSSDQDIFMFARQHGFDAIMTLDDDFNHLQMKYGIPPKLIWIRGRNSTTAALATAINEKVVEIYGFLIDNDLDCLEILR